MVNILLTSALLISSKLVAGANIPDGQIANANVTIAGAQAANADGEADYKLKHCGCHHHYDHGHDHHHHHHHHKSMNIEMFNTNYYRNGIGSKTIHPGRCYHLPNIDSCRLDGGAPGEGTVKFCTGHN
ncbi:hypothetical protein AX774_g5501 [Zancudomyces culisetae]|uniref:Uncharacterized protein n=1 Tax=Zancudomyces culisetae TaxID=1213189 RepID=A0A1R1PJC4_ZANCU|nr:hypothetical protein AX774_g5501 [Zancudomyces culisetae]|eukprot:OMH81048.1 hypothetical protein AX774_g5501 [Zancudomyces culisetae]